MRRSEKRIEAYDQLFITLDQAKSLALLLDLYAAQLVLPPEEIPEALPPDAVRLAGTNLLCRLFDEAQELGRQLLDEGRNA